MYTKCESWPSVLPNDDGIRPAGPQDECLYCSQKIGQPHGPECVTVNSKVRFGVYCNNHKVGVWRSYEPHGWTAQQHEFHKNEGSWCADNALHAIEWVTPEIRHLVMAQMVDDECACGILTFQLEAVEDAGPFVTLRDDTALRPRIFIVVLV